MKGLTKLNILDLGKKNTTVISNIGYCHLHYHTVTTSVSTSRIPTYQKIERQRSKWNNLGHLF